MKEKLKSFLADDALYMAFVIILVGVLAFLLGRLSVVQNTQQLAAAVNPLSLCPTTVCSIAPPSLPVAVPGATASAEITTIPTPPTTASYVASKSGTKYHHLMCPGAKQIKEENKIFFATTAQAEAAGYSKAANCNR